LGNHWVGMALDPSALNPVCVCSGSFAQGEDTIIECNGCTKGADGEDEKKCFPGAQHYGDDWKSTDPTAEEHTEI
jgi:hypothetical protein